MYREISIAFDSKRRLCAMGTRRLTHGDTDLDMFPDSTVYQYIPRIHGSQSDYDCRVNLVVVSSVFLVCWNECISVNCKMSNELIISTEQRVFIYDQYLLAQSASQFQCAKLNVCSMTELLVGFYGLIILPTWSLCDFFLWGGLKNAVYKTNPHTLEELNCNICGEIISIEEKYSELWEIL